jgi:polyhydroxyalkanoate synthase
MAAAFQMLNSNDLIWSRLIHDYLMGQRTPMIDLMALECRHHAHALSHAF